LVPGLVGISFVFDHDLATGAPGPHRLLDEAEDQPRGARDHQDQPDGVDADVGDMHVGGEVEDRSDGDQEYRPSDRHQILPTRSKISSTIAIKPRMPPATATLSRTSASATMTKTAIMAPTMSYAFSYCSAALALERVSSSLVITPLGRVETDGSSDLRQV